MAQASRVVRVFISSTFRDMQEEREELIKRVFPQLRKLCESRGVVWGEVDLRWGIPDEAKAEGKVLPICLAEIHRCRPYFIGMLGERYGWVPEEIPPELIAQEPWLKEHLHHSVTELEILHGVLQNPAMADHAFFYFRAPSYVDSQPPKDQANFREGPTPEEVQKFGKETAELRAEDRRAKLAALKGRIRRSGLSLEENYSDPKNQGQLVLRDLTAVIDRLFPEGSQPDPLDREAAVHEAYARSRAVVEVRPGEFSGVYIGRDEYLARLDAHAQGYGPPLVVLGESGMGKSALLANWALRYRPRHPQDHLIMHFIGAGPTSADWAAMLRRLMEELKRRFDIPQDIPDQPDALRLSFANFLSMAAAQGRVVLIIDALNQLEDREGAPDLVWLPPLIPANIRLILSTLPGRPLDDLQKRGWPTLAVESLEVTERRRLIKEYLAQHRKELSTPELERLAAAPPTANPLYLWALLEELRVYGDHDTLKLRLDHYLMAPGVKELYELILARYEGDYEGDRPGLVEEAMSLIAAARRGLSQAELLDLLGTEGEPLPGAVWSPLHLAAEHALMDRAGLITFGHDYFRQAVGDRYLGSKDKRQAAHLGLADYFDGQDLEIGEGLNLRKIDELPWQLVQAGEWERLKRLLVEPLFSTLAWLLDQFEVKACWAQIEENSPLRLTAAYRGVLDDPAQHEAAYVWYLAMLLSDAGHLQEALALRAHLVEHYRRTGDLDNLSTCLGNQALILQVQGDPDGAMALHQEEERLCRELGNKKGLSNSLGNQGVVLSAWGDFDGAMALHKEQERLCRELGDKCGLSSSLGSQGLILYVQGDPDGAMALHMEQERLFRELGDKYGLSYSLGQQATILYARGDLDGAMALYQEQERLCRVLGNKFRLHDCLDNQGLILRARGDLDGAMALYQEQERLCPGLGNLQRRILSAANQANLLAEKLERSHEALPLADEANRLATEHPDVAASLNNLAEPYNAQGCHAEANTLFLRLRRQMEEIILHQVLNSILQELNTKANQVGFFLQVSQEGITIFPGKEGNPMSEEELNALSEEGRESLRQNVGVLHDEMKEAIGKIALIEKDFMKFMEELDRDEAFEEFQSTLEKILGPEHPSALQALMSLAQFLRDQGRHQQSAKSYLKLATTLENLIKHGIQATPETLWMAAISYNEIAFHTEVPAQNWSAAKEHYRRSLELFQQAGLPLEAANVELNLQTLLHLSGQPVDVERVKELARILEEAGDKRADKGRKLLQELA